MPCSIIFENFPLLQILSSTLLDLFGGEYDILTVKGTIASSVSVVNSWKSQPLEVSSRMIQTIAKSYGPRVETTGDFNKDLANLVLDLVTDKTLSPYVHGATLSKFEFSHPSRGALNLGCLVDKVNHSASCIQPGIHQPMRLYMLHIDHTDALHIHVVSGQLQHAGVSGR